MRKAACAKDVRGFFACIDRPRLAQSTRDFVTSDAKPKNALDAAASRIAASLASQLFEHALANDVREGDQGKLCTMKLVSVQRGKRTIVVWRNTKAQLSRLVFAQSGGAWKFVGLVK